MKSPLILVLITLIVQFFSPVYSQGPTTPFSSRCLAWRNFSWNENEYYNQNSKLTQVNSDYDWWYDNCTYYTQPNSKTGVKGYMACGVSMYRADKNTANPPITYDERPYGGCAFGQAPFVPNPNNCRSYAYGNHENCVTGKLGMPFNTIGRVDDNGSLVFLILMNFYGEYTRTKQLSDGTFLTVGHSAATRKKWAPPQNGAPLLYNPPANNYFIYNNVFNIFNPNHTNSTHWDVMKYDHNGVCLFNNIYGQNDFGSSQTNTFGSKNNLSYTQISYLSSGFSYDFIQKQKGKNAQDRKIAIVGMQQRSIPNIGIKYKASIVQIFDNGNVSSKMYLDKTMNKFESVARAIVVTSGTNPYYLIAITKQSTNNNTVVEIVALPYNFTSTDTPISIATLGQNYSIGDIKAGSTAWGMTIKNGFLYIPVIEKCNNVWWADDNFGDLVMYKISIPSHVPITTPTNTVITSNFITNVRAFDLKARIIDLTNGNLAIISTVQKAPWTFGTPPNYILGITNSTYSCCDNTNPANPGTTTSWNTDAYVAEISPATLGVNWSFIFNSDNALPSASNSTQWRTPTFGGGDPKHQECMYGISEGPAQSIIVSGNSSGNVDDNYMAKIIICSTVPDDQKPN